MLLIDRILGEKREKEKKKREREREEERERERKRENPANVRDEFINLKRTLALELIYLFF